MSVLTSYRSTNSVWGPATEPLGTVLYCIVKSSQAVGLRDRVAIIQTLIFSSPHPYAGSGEVSVGKAARRNLSVVAKGRIDREPGKNGVGLH